MGLGMSMLMLTWDVGDMGCMSKLMLEEHRNR